MIGVFKNLEGKFVHFPAVFTPVGIGFIRDNKLLTREEIEAENTLVFSGVRK